MTTYKRILINIKFRSRRGQRLVSSTFVSKNDDSDFVTVESPISFNKRKLSDKQKEKMKEKRDARSGLNFNLEIQCFFGVFIPYRTTVNFAEKKIHAF